MMKSIKNLRPRPPSDKQMEVLRLITANPGMSMTKAALQAGYSATTARNVGQLILKRPQFLEARERFKLELKEHGIDTDLVAKKLKQLLEAKDERIQLDTTKLLMQTFKIMPDEPTQQGLKRRISLEEFENKEFTSDAR